MWNTDKQVIFFFFAIVFFLPTDFWDIEFNLLKLLNCLTDIIVIGGKCFIFWDTWILSWIFSWSTSKFLKFNMEKTKTFFAPHCSSELGRSNFFLSRVTGSNPEKCWTFFLFGQQLQLEVWNYIHSKLMPISFQKNHSSSDFIKTVQQDMTLHLRSSLFPSHCKSYINLLCRSSFMHDHFWKSFCPCSGYHKIFVKRNCKERVNDRNG